MPNTHSNPARVKRAKSFDSEIDDTTSGSSFNDEIISTSFEKHPEHAQVSFDELRGQLKASRKENKRLKRELASSQVPVPPIKHPKLRLVSDGSEDDDMNLEDIQLRDRVRNLEDKVKNLTNENHRQQKLIKKFERKELQDEVKDLTQKSEQGSDREGELDPEYRMRKLLRKFSDLMSITTIEDEKRQMCPVCWEGLEPKKCLALECEHILCYDCLRKMSRGADESVKCGECRQYTLREDIELVSMTESQRWDSLLDVAKAWVAFDIRGEEETSEEEAEEEFINDETETSDLSLQPNQDESVDEEEAAASVDDSAATPPPSSHRSFFESPMKEKRKRLKELAEERTNKRRK